MVTVLAHAGGWDELLIFAVPLALYGAVRLWERYRGDDEEATDEDGDSS